jgi:hypothetical protein
MTEHDYLVPGMAVLWLVANCLGAAFTLRRRSRRAKAAGRARETVV